MKDRKISTKRFSYDSFEQTASLSKLIVENARKSESRGTPVDEAETRNLLGNKILESLRYPMMSQQLEEVSETHLKTLNWGFDKTTDQPRILWTSSTDWLQN